MRRVMEVERRAQEVLADPRWALMSARDKSAEGTFLFGVATTGVYCRPSCGARLPRPENVRFFRTAAEAEGAGFRPCKRCCPTGLPRAAREAARITDACRLIENADSMLSLETLARSVGMSPSHFHRMFRKTTGLTPAEYARAHQSDRMRRALAEGEAVTQAIYDAGYGSSSRFYESADEVLGMTPKAFQDGGAGKTIRFATGEVTLGCILVAKSDRGICAVLLGDDPEALVRDLQDRFPKAELIGDEKGFGDLVARAVGLVESPGAAHDLPLDIRGTVFQRRVWKALQDIPPGSTATYADIAGRIGMSRAVRAVAQACKANPLAIAIPCHRVIKSDGTLSGYRWGAERKRLLLQREACALKGTDGAVI
jgi:AraC family transcriptional regulator, regulatory protein of adaptative response / methylated-DNA-[protein]-cysteine methyltransferase